MNKTLAFVAATAAAALVGVAAYAGPMTTYRAQLETPVTERTRVVASSVVWICEGNACTAQKEARNATVRQCKALAEEVGRISSFTSATQLSAEQIAECNTRARG
jgi:hypothetical protein